jgi:putative Holliday junction resolvase
MIQANTNHLGNFMALDVGAARVGVALASAQARLAHPHGTLPADDSLFEDLQKLCHSEHVAIIVVGLPRGLDGQETAQTAHSREFADKLVEHLGGSVKVALQDEALTSKKALAELSAAKKQFARSDVDALAAVYILEDYLQEHFEGRTYEYPF